MILRPNEKINEQSWWYISALCGIWFGLIFFITLFAYMGTPSLILEPVSWLVNIELQVDLDGYHYGTVSGMSYTNYYINELGDYVIFNGFLLILLATLFFCLIGPIVYLLYMLSTNRSLICYRILLIWAPIYILLLILKIK